MQLTDSDAGRRDRRAGISPQTLVVASVASAAASFAVSRTWGAGTLISAAVTPVIVAVVTEFLHRPVQTVAATGRRVPASQRIASGRDRDRDDRTSLGPHPETIAYTSTGTRRPRWRLVIATGLVATAIVVGAYTVPDLITGRSITGNGHSTTFFGGGANDKTKPTVTTTVTTTTPAPTTTTTPATAATMPGATTTTPATTTPPAATTPAIQRRRRPRRRSRNQRLPRRSRPAPRQARDMSPDARPHAALEHGETSSLGSPPVGVTILDTAGFGWILRLRRDGRRRSQYPDEARAAASRGGDMLPRP